MVTSRRNRILKPLSEKLHALDDHQYLLREALHGQQTDAAYFKALSAELRVLICESSGTEGLLWRLADELGVSDKIPLAAAGCMNRDHPLARDMLFAFASVIRAEYCPTDAQFLVDDHSLRQVIKTYEALYLSSLSNYVITHEELIKAVSQQIGTAHEAEEINPQLARLRQVILNGQESYVQPLRLDAELALQIGERILDHAEEHLQYQRQQRPSEKGDLSLVLRFGLRSLLASRVPVVSFRFHVGEAALTCSAGPASMVFSLTKRGRIIGEFKADYPKGLAVNRDMLVCFNYSSASRKARVITSGEPVGSPVECDAGWLDAREYTGPFIHEERKGWVYIQNIMIYEKLVGSHQANDLLAASVDLQEVWKIDANLDDSFPP